MEFGRLDAFDAMLFRRLHDLRIPMADEVLPPLTRTADYGVLWLASAGSLAATGRPANRRAALRGLLSLTVAATVANGPAKWVVRRQRPAMEDVPELRRLRRRPTTRSFPSGHSASAAGFVAGVAIEQPLLAPPLGLLALGVGFSRVYLGVHYPMDVVAGMLLGAACALALTKVWPAGARPPCG